jgi:very-short-patch-repair endonuclease
VFRCRPADAPLGGVNLQPLRGWADAHHGLITWTIAERAGISRSAWYRSIRSSQVDLLHPGVVRLPGARDTPEQRIAAATLAVPGSQASHRSGARLWGGERPDRDPVDLIVEREMSNVRLDGVVIHRPRDRVDLGASTRSGIRCVNVLRVLCDLGEVDPVGLPAMVEHAIVRGYTTPKGLHALVARHARPGRSGIPQLRSVLEAWPLGDKPADSVLETAFARFVKERGLPAVEFHPVISGLEVDFRFIGSPFVVECDGWDDHGRPVGAFARDLERTAVLLAAGHPTLRFTWEMLMRRPDWLERQIRSALERISPEILRAG